jgi:hypothetical protein
VTQAQENHVHIWIDGVGKIHFDVAQQIVVRYRKRFSRIGRAVHKIQFGIGVKHQYSDKFPSRIS